MAMLLFQRTESRIFDPRVRVFGVTILMILAILTSNLIGQVILLLYVVGELVAIKRLRHALKAIIYAVPFFILIILSNIYIANLTLYEALIPALRLLVIVLLSLSFFITVYPDDISILLDKLKVPKQFSLAFTLSIRFIPSMFQMINDIKDAQMARGLELSKGGLLTRIKNLIPILTPTIILAIKKSISVAEALETRGIDFKAKRTHIVEYKLRRIDYIYILIIIIVMILTIFSPIIQSSLYLLLKF